MTATEWESKNWEYHHDYNGRNKDGSIKWKCRAITCKTCGKEIKPMTDRASFRHVFREHEGKKEEFLGLGLNFKPGYCPGE